MGSEWIKHTMIVTDFQGLHSVSTKQTGSLGVISVDLRVPSKLPTEELTPLPQPSPAFTAPPPSRQGLCHKHPPQGLQQQL